MENKEKQMIEKTIDILYDLNDTYKSLPREQLENAIKFGSYYDVVKLIKLGYRKINKNEVILTKEAYDKLCHLAYFGYDDAYEKGSQETVEKFVNLDDSDILVVDTPDYGEIDVVSVERLQEIAKQLGVDIKEN